VNFHSLVKNSPLRILVVEDELLIRWSIVETLGQEGHVVLEADTAESAVLALQASAGPVDVVLLDFRLPDSNDFTLLHNIRRLAPDASVILMTAHGTPDVMRSALEQGACRVMNKPFDMQEVAAAVVAARVARPH
jgi:DNA-binding NtrC family response regulator